MMILPLYKYFVAFRFLRIAFCRRVLKLVINYMHNRKQNTDFFVIFSRIVKRANWNKIWTFRNSFLCNKKFEKDFRLPNVHSINFIVWCMKSNINMLAICKRKRKYPRRGCLWEKQSVIFPWTLSGGPFQNKSRSGPLRTKITITAKN